MALSIALDVYLQLEAAMLELDRANSALADRVRDMMDPIWDELTDEDRDYLDARTAEDIDRNVMRPSRAGARSKTAFSAPSAGTATPRAGSDASVTFPKVA